MQNALYGNIYSDFRFVKDSLSIGRREGRNEGAIEALPLVHDAGARELSSPRGLKNWSFWGEKTASEESKASSLFSVPSTPEGCRDKE